MNLQRNMIYERLCDKLADIARKKERIILKICYNTAAHCIHIANERLIFLEGESALQMKDGSSNNN